MLISNEDPRYIFIHIQKTGGITVSGLLTRLVPGTIFYGPRHMHARKALRLVEDSDSCFKFAFVRNPWDRLASWYSMMDKGRRRLRASNEVPSVQRRRFSNNPLYRDVLRHGPTFEDFLKHCTQRREIKDGHYYSFAFNQLDYLTNKNGKLLVDFIGRFENFSEDLSHVFKVLGVGVEEIPHRNRTEHSHYSEMYTPETEQIVRERFRRDIEYFGYEFGR
jgi:hypothetical protein